MLLNKFQNTKELPGYILIPSFQSVHWAVLRTYVISFDCKVFSKYYEKRGSVI